MLCRPITDTWPRSCAEQSHVCRQDIAWSIRFSSLYFKGREQVHLINHSSGPIANRFTPMAHLRVHILFKTCGVEMQYDWLDISMRMFYTVYSQEALISIWSNLLCRSSFQLQYDGCIHWVLCYSVHWTLGKSEWTQLTLPSLTVYLPT